MFKKGNYKTFIVFVIPFKKFLRFFTYYHTFEFEKFYQKKIIFEFFMFSAYSDFWDILRTTEKIANVKEEKSRKPSENIDKLEINR